MPADIQKIIKFVSKSCYYCIKHCRQSRYETLLSVILLFVILYIVVHYEERYYCLRLSIFENYCSVMMTKELINYLLSVILPSLQIGYFFSFFMECLSFPRILYESQAVRLFWVVLPKLTV
jgi:hypothetical protein